MPTKYYKRNRQKLLHFLPQGFTYLGIYFDDEKSMMVSFGDFTEFFFFWHKRKFTLGADLTILSSLDNLRSPSWPQDLFRYVHGKELCLGFAVLSAFVFFGQVSRPMMLRILVLGSGI